MGTKKLKRRSAAILAVAAAGAVAVAGIALANSQTLAGSKFAPSKLPKNTFKAGSLFVHTHATYTNPGNANPGGATERAQLYFDDDGKLNPAATPRCDPAALSGNITMAQAMAACASAKVGAGTAQATANGAFFVNGCALIFNGKNNAQGQPTSLVFTRVQVASPPDNNITCESPASNTKGNTSILLKGAIKPNPADVPGTSNDGDFSGGKMVDYNNITDVAALPLTDFNVKVQKANYVSARCHDADKRLNIRGKFTYNNGTSQLAAASQACTIG
jgi:hypothetical protein